MSNPVSSTDKTERYEIIQMVFELELTRQILFFKYQLFN
jgi:hypothetical protein